MLVSGSSDNTNQINRFQEYLDYLDVKQHVIQGLAKVVHSAENKNINTSVFRSNVMIILELIDLQEPNQKNYESNTLLCKDVKYDYNYENVFNSFFFIIFERFGILHAFANFKDAFGNFNIYLSLSLKCTNVLSRSYYKKSHILKHIYKGT